MQEFTDMYIPAWLIVVGILYVNLTYIVRFWLNDTPFKYRYIALTVAWLPTLVFYIIIQVDGVAVAFDWRWLTRWGLVTLLLSSILLNENTWKRAYQKAFSNSGWLHGVKQ
jgi:hypothetical protein